MMKAEFLADTLHRKSKSVLPHLAHFFLVSTFFEDGLRMVCQWDYHRDYLDFTWDCGYYLASSLVLANCLTQLIGSLMITVRYHVKLACVLLGSSVILQTFAYSIFKDTRILIRFFSLLGSLLLLYAEGHKETKCLSAGVPSLGNNKPKSYMQLTGRVLVAFLFVTSIRAEPSILQFLKNGFASVMIALVAIGYKTKLSALVLAAWLFTMNMRSHASWMILSDPNLRESLRYDFFQTLSVVGGLILIVSRGPGDVSVDERKKLF